MIEGHLENVYVLFTESKVCVLLTLLDFFRVYKDANFRVLTQKRLILRKGIWKFLIQ